LFSPSFLFLILNDPLTLEHQNGIKQPLQNTGSRENTGRMQEKSLIVRIVVPVQVGIHALPPQRTVRETETLTGIAGIVSTRRPGNSNGANLRLAGGAFDQRRFEIRNPLLKSVWVDRSWKAVSIA
jgi:hypothetical protein